MDQLQNFLSQWIISAGIPAFAVITFFWKGDDALSAEFKQWLSAKISGLTSAGSEISIIQPLANVFDRVFGQAYFSIGNLARVAAVSIVAAIIGFYSFGLYYNDLDNMIRLTWVVLVRPVEFVSLLAINILFDFVSFAKARLIMRRIRYNTLLFLVIDLILTFILLVVYFGVFISVGEWLFQPVLDRNEFIYLSYQAGMYFLAGGFFVSTFLIVILTVLYVIAIGALRAIHPARVFASILIWIFPVNTLPVRSIGMMSGGVMFAILAVTGLFR